MSHLNPLNKDIVIVDENYTGGYASAYAEAGVKIDGILKEYTKLLKDLVESKNFSGTTADRLYEYAQTAEELLGGQAESFGTRMKNLMADFQREIDLADEEIY